MKMKAPRSRSGLGGRGLLDGGRQSRYRRLLQDTKAGTITGTLGAGGRYLSLAPGCSKKANPCLGRVSQGRSHRLGSTRKGNLSLDFGAVYPGELHGLRPDVFGITSSARRPRTSPSP